MIETFLILRIIDVLTTIALIEGFGAIEANPLMRTVIGWGWGYYALIQAFALYSVLVLTTAYQDEWIKKALVIINIVTGIAVVGNLLALFVAM